MLTKFYRKSFHVEKFIFMFFPRICAYRTCFCSIKAVCVIDSRKYIKTKKLPKHMLVLTMCYPTYTKAEVPLKTLIADRIKPADSVIHNKL